MTSSIVIYGAGGHAEVVRDVAVSAGYAVLGFLDERRSLSPESKVLGDASWLRDHSEVLVALGVGDNHDRVRIYLDLLGMGCLIAPCLVHASASVSPSALLERGSAVMAGAVVNARARVRHGAIINSAAVVEHDSTVGEFAHVAPGAVMTGHCHLREGALLGARAVMLPRTALGAWSVAGAGAVITRDVEPKETVVGCPARPLDGRPRATMD